MVELRAILIFLLGISFAFYGGRTYQNGVDRPLISQYTPQGIAGSVASSPQMSTASGNATPQADAGGSSGAPVTDSPPPDASASGGGPAQAGN